MPAYFSLDYLLLMGKRKLKERMRGKKNRNGEERVGQRKGKERRGGRGGKETGARRREGNREGEEDKGGGRDVHSL